MADRDWLRIYEGTKRQIIAKRQAGQGISPSESKSINEAISRLDAQLKDMMASPMEYEIAASELARRQSLVENLQKQMAIVPQGVGGSGSAAVSNPMAHSDKGLIQRQKDVIRLQDDMIMDIGHGTAESVARRLRYMTQSLLRSGQITRASNSNRRGHKNADQTARRPGGYVFIFRSCCVLMTRVHLQARLTTQPTLLLQSLSEQTTFARRPPRAGCISVWPSSSWCS